MTRYWQMRNGECIRICDMTDSHLLNTIKLLQRYAERKRIAAVMDWFSTPDWMLPNEGSHAFDDHNLAECELMEQTWEDYLPPIYSAMTSDAQTRGLAVPDFNPGMAGEVRVLQAVCEAKEPA